MFKPQYTYHFTIGTSEFYTYSRDDRQAKRLLARWLKLVWPKVVASCPDCSIAHAINTVDWAGRFPQATIKRVWCESAYTVPDQGWATIESFEATDGPIGEFVRVFGRRPVRPTAERVGSDFRI